MPVDNRNPAREADEAPQLRDNACWCGASDLQPFSPTYSRCGACQSLITRHPYTSALFQVENDAEDFYGKEYWFSHQQTDLEQPGILTRTRTDLPERVVHWLRVLLKYKQPPARTLELGSAHGGFVAMLRWAGFDASGLEMSPWVVSYARETFGVSMYQGALEQQQIEPQSLDVIALMDVLEHLPDPVTTMRRAVDLLKPGGILLIQTPRYQAGTSYETLVERDDPFLVQLKTDEHVYLFSDQGIRELLTRVGAQHVACEPAIFGHYDMFMVASASPLQAAADQTITDALCRTASGRLVRAFLDLADQRDDAQRRYAELVPLQADVVYLKEQIATIEADRAARLEVIQRQAADSARAAELQASIERLQEQLSASEQSRSEKVAELAALKRGARESRELIQAARSGRLIRVAGALWSQGAATTLARASAILARLQQPSDPRSSQDSTPKSEGKR